MSSIFTQDLRTQNAVDFNDLISRQTANNRVYFTFGKPTAWANDAAPDQANTSVAVYNNMWNSMIGSKLVTGNEVKNAVKKTEWSANVVYQVYDDCLCSTKLYGPNSKFHVVTSDWHVYKCLDNSSNSNSTVMPTQVYVDKAIEESDGYVWRYMYTIPAEDRIRFTTPSYIPVKYLKESDGSLQWQVQANAVPGAIESTIITNPGTNYTTACTVTVTITGDGTGATALPRVNTQSNTISSIIISSKGSGYTHANVIISDSGTGVNATARAVLSPPGGHGSNPLFELGGSYLVLNPRLKGSENGKFPTVNEFRQVSLLLNPKERATNNAAANVIYSQLVIAVLDTGITNYNQDELVYQGPSLSSATFTGIVENWDFANSEIRLTNTTGTIAADVLVGANSGTSRFVQFVTDKELKPYSGSMLYINNLTPISRADDQIEDFKIVMAF